MPLELDCPGCQKHYSVPDAMAGKKVKCKCGTSFEAVAALETDALEELSDDGGLSSMDDLLGDVGVGGESSDPFGDTDVLGMSSASDPLALGGTSAQAKTPGVKASQTAANEAAANQLALMTSCVIGGVALLTSLICLFLSGASLAMLMLFMGLAVGGFAVVACMVGIEKAAWPLVGAHGLMAVVGLGFGIYHYSQREQPVIAEVPTTPTTDPSATNPSNTNPTTPPMTDPVTGKPIDPENTHPPMPDPMTPSTPMKPEGEKPTSNPPTPDPTSPTNPSNSDLNKINVTDNWTVKFDLALAADPAPEGAHIGGLSPNVDKLNEKLKKLKLEPKGVRQLRPFSPWVFLMTQSGKDAVWNLTSGTSILEFNGATDHLLTVSFDGRRIHFTDPQNAKKGHFMSLENGALLFSQESVGARETLLVNFVAQDRHLILNSVQKPTDELLIFEMLKGRPIYSFASGKLRPARISISGGGRYGLVRFEKKEASQKVGELEVAVFSSGFDLLDFTTGKVVAEFRPKLPNRLQFPGDLTLEIEELLGGLPITMQQLDADFSPDGQWLAMLEHNQRGESRILLIELATGNLTQALALPAEALKDAKSPHPLVWTPDGNGFLLNERVLVSRQDGKIITTMPTLKDNETLLILSPSEFWRADLSKTPAVFAQEGPP